GRPFRLIKSIQGRVEETLYFPGSDGNRIAIHPLVFDPVMDALPAKGWQVVQEPGSLDILVVGLAPDHPDARIIDALRAALKSHGAKIPEIRLIRVAEIPRGPTGKAPLIRSNLDRDAAGGTG
ncbi:MAG: hypothetical protein ACREVG_02970, partial [Burkholderiales bacterium]